MKQLRGELLVFILKHPEASSSRHIRPAVYDANILTFQSPPFARKSPDKVLLQQEIVVAVSPSIKVLSDTVLGTFAKTKVPEKRFETLEDRTAGFHPKELRSRDSMSASHSIKDKPHRGEGA